ncbi:MAG: ABC transporter permease subunit [Armatimonadetes bacterium]|nr:ABC transporter permease subunit [Armatimonadota bacterium]
MLSSPANIRETIFKSVSTGPLLIYTFFVVAILLSDFLYVGGRAQVTRTDLLKNEGAAIQEIWFALRLSLWTSAIATFIAILMGIPAAYALSRYKLPFTSVIDTVLDLPIVLPPLIAGISLLVFFHQTGAGKWLESIVPITYTTTAIVIAQITVAGAFAIRTLKATFDSINPRLEYVARTLGCTRRQAFFKITLPLARNGVVAGTVMTWTRAVSEFAPILIFAGGTKGKTSVLPVTAYLYLSTGYVELALLVTIIMIVIGVVALVLFKRLGGQGYIW